MATTTRKIPTSADIYLEINGTRVAVVQSYQVTAKRTSQTVEAFGQEEPVATIRGQTQYALSLSRLYATDEALRDGIRGSALVVLENAGHFAYLEQCAAFLRIMDAFFFPEGKEAR